ncbi:hypothetical protein LCGC14_1915060 [marine sediment metagenome]|uniref:Uncharacterized protein n=1 Tax=marine sediment metagenome TaxID=412755 RepID=A0A0F9FT59_9ZZZZ
MTNKKIKRNYAELASVGYPDLDGIRLRYSDGCGQWIVDHMLRDNPEDMVEFLNNWIKDDPVFKGLVEALEKITNTFTGNIQFDEMEIREIAENALKLAKGEK